MPELPRNIQSESLTKIGSGEYKQVYVDPNDPHKVLKIHNETGFKNEDKESIHLVLGMEFYLTKILHLLESELIPDIHMASVAGQIQTVLDRILLFRPATNKKRQEIKNKFDNYGISIDENPDNFRETIDGKPVYVDSPIGGYPEKIIDIDDEKIRSAIQRLPKSQQKTALQYLDRFLKLKDRHLKKFKTNKHILSTQIVL